MLTSFYKTIKNKWIPYALAYSAKFLIRLLLKTCRCEVHGVDQFSETANHSPCILMLWHNRLILVGEILNRFAPQFIYTAFVSKSRDGEPLSLMATSYKAGRVLRVPHNARHKALKEMIVHLKTQKEVILITPDGPRGPRYVLKPGVIMAAKESSAAAIPFSWESDRFWQLNTWDQLRIPKPFSKIKIVFGECLFASRQDNVSLEEEMKTFQSALDNVASFKSL